MSVQLAGLKIVVDVQHAYRDGMHAHDRGTVYVLADGSHVNESDCARQYADALIAALRTSGATVWTNDPAHAKLIGPYSRRQIEAGTLGANAYVACHLNAGVGKYALAEYVSRDNLGLSSPFAPETIRLCEAVTRELVASFPNRLSGPVVKELRPGERGAVCVSGFAGPAAILEPLFGDNPDHQGLLTIAGLQYVGEAIARGIAAWWLKEARLV